ncbi:MAG: hypothetical protein WBD65_17125, partial [Methylocella sp.]
MAPFGNVRNSRILHHADCRFASNASCEFHPIYGQADVDATGGSVPIRRKTIDRLFDSGMLHPIRSARRDWMIEMRFKICHSISAIAGLFLAFAPFAAPCAMAEPSDLDLVCSGNSYGKLGDPFPTTETVSFKREGKKPAMIGLPGS